ncbi:MAG TPA: TetR/AcrR family transcriptional regulator [Polyangiales bacterium]|nr:TetR/AcrR family transcriptional regulator [Polyangiales bacterium]
MDDTPRGRLLRAAAHLFLEKGYERTTMRELAEAVGILSGSIFHHFDSKPAILEQVMAEVIELNTELLEHASESETAPRARLRALIHRELESIHGDTSEAMTLLVAEWRSLDAGAQKRILTLRDRYERIWLDAIELADRERVPMSPFLFRRLLGGAIAATSMWYAPSGSIDIDELADAILLLGVKTPERSA